MSTTKNNKKTAFPVGKIIHAAVLAAFAANSWANPSGATVVNGSATMLPSPNGSGLTITNSNGAIINWNSFSIGTGESVRFNQASASSAVLNRVTGGNPTEILGSLTSNGKVYLINPNGILFGAGAQVNVAGLVASTLNMSDADFLNGRDHFTADRAVIGSIKNQGNLLGGKIALIAPNIDNSGVIVGNQGEVILAAGYTVDLMDTTSPNLRVVVYASADDINITQLIAAAGGNIARIHDTGKITATSATQTPDGVVHLRSAGSIALNADTVKGDNLVVWTEATGGTGTSDLTATGANLQASSALTVNIRGGAINIDPTSTLTAGQSASYLADKSYLVHKNMLESAPKVDFVSFQDLTIDEKSIAAQDISMYSVGTTVIKADLSVNSLQARADAKLADVYVLDAKSSLDLSSGTYLYLSNAVAGTTASIYGGSQVIAGRVQAGTGLSLSGSGSVSSTGSLQAPGIGINGTTVTLSGNLTGNVYANASKALRSTANITGDSVYLSAPYTLLAYSTITAVNATILGDTLSTTGAALPASNSLLMNGMTLKISDTLTLGREASTVTWDPSLTGGAYGGSFNVPASVLDAVLLTGTKISAGTVNAVVTNATLTDSVVDGTTTSWTLVGSPTLALNNSKVIADVSTISFPNATYNNNVVLDKTPVSDITTYTSSGNTGFFTHTGAASVANTGLAVNVAVTPPPSSAPVDPCVVDPASCVTTPPVTQPVNPTPPSTSPSSGASTDPCATNPSSCQVGSSPTQTPPSSGPANGSAPVTGNPIAPPSTSPVVDPCVTDPASCVSGSPLPVTSPTLPVTNPVAAPVPPITQPIAAPVIDPCVANPGSCVGSQPVTLPTVPTPPTQGPATSPVSSPVTGLPVIGLPAPVQTPVIAPAPISVPVVSPPVQGPISTPTNPAPTPPASSPIPQPVVAPVPTPVTFPTPIGGTPPVQTPVTPCVSSVANCVLIQPVQGPATQPVVPIPAGPIATLPVQRSPIAVVNPLVAIPLAGSPVLVPADTTSPTVSPTIPDAKAPEVAINQPIAETPVSSPTPAPKPGFSLVAGYGCADSDGSLSPVACVLNWLKLNNN